MLRLKDLVEWANSEEGKKYLDYTLNVQMPVGSSCFSNDIDNVEQIGIGEKSLLFIPDYCLYTDSKWYENDEYENGTYPIIFDLDKEYYLSKQIAKRQLVEGE